MEGFDEVIGEFLVESYESLDALDQDLLALEGDPEDRDRLASIFRTVHTIKGTSGFLAFPKLERIAHVGENLLVPLRDGEFDLNRDIADGLLGMVDAIREILTAIESGGAEGEAEYEVLANQLEQLLHDQSSGGTAEAADSIPSDATTAPDPSEVENRSESLPAASADETAAPPATGEVMMLNPLPPRKSPPASESPDENRSAGAKQPSQSPPPKDPAPSKSKKERGPSVADSSVRIDVGLLDGLMNLVGELVLTRNQILQHSESSQDASVHAASQRLNHITSELQESVMKTRMQPIRVAWNKLPRIVRDLAASCGKEIEVVMEGADTELDKTILEAIKDPLTHIVRNSVDHGIESPDVRAANGKPAEGVLTLRAFHEGGQVNIEIQDDGGGISSARVAAKAIEKGLITAQQAEEMKERDLINLILLPGFSTAEKVTNVSGRGVGMDVVRTNIEKIGGVLDITSLPGEGTTLKIKIPLTLAIVPALICKSGGGEYAIPQISLLELLRLDRERARNSIEFIHDTPVYRLRGNLLPIIYLDEQLGVRAKRKRDEVPESANIVVLQAEERQFGLVVDAITDTQEIVVKPLGQHLKQVHLYAGATIMGDGTVALILDVVGLAQKSSVLTETRERALLENENSDNENSKPTEPLLIVDPGDDTRAAILLATVARLEEFDAAKVERSGQRDVIQYCDDILPLIYLNGGGGGSGDGAEPLQTVVYSNGDRSVGIVVGEIIDIVHDQIHRAQGTAQTRKVIQDRVTEIIDLPQLISQHYPEFNLQPQEV